MAIVVLDTLPTAAGALVATVVFGSLVVVAVAPVGRRTAEEWAPIAVAFAGRRLLGQARFRSPVPTRGMLASLRRAGGAGRVSSPEPEAPAPLRGLRIVDAEYRDRAIGALSEHGGRRLTAVLACRVVAFSLLDAEAQERRLARWGLVLVGRGGRPGAPDPVGRAHGARAGRRTGPLAAGRARSGGPAAGHGDDRVLPGADRHDHQGHAGARDPDRRAGRRAPGARARRRRDAGDPDRAHRARRPGPRGGRGDRARRAQRRAARAHAADRVRSVRAERNWRRSRRPTPSATGLPSATLGRSEPARPGTTTAATAPCTRRIWIGGWPRVDVSPMFMDALLGRSSAVRTVAVTFEPIASRALDPRGRGGDHPRPRRPRACVHRFGQSETARQRQAHDATATPRGRARRRPWRGQAGRVRDRLRTRSRRPAARLQRGPRACRPGPARAAPDVRPAG